MDITFGRTLIAHSNNNYSWCWWFGGVTSALDLYILLGAQPLRKITPMFPYMGLQNCWINRSTTDSHPILRRPVYVIISRRWFSLKKLKHHLNLVHHVKIISTVCVDVCKIVCFFVVRNCIELLKNKYILCFHFCPLAMLLLFFFFFWSLSLFDRHTTIFREEEIHTQVPYS